MPEARAQDGLFPGGGDRRVADLMLASASVGLGVLLCLPALDNMSSMWRRIDFYGHAYAIPVVAGFLAFQNRRVIGAALRDLRPPAWGAPVVFAAAAFQVLAVMGDAGFFSGLGIPLLLGATAYAIGGRPLLQPLLLPLGFLALMVPPPAFLISQLLVQLKLFVTEAAVGILQAVGVTVGSEGNQILVPGHTLFVADACSGLTSIVTLLPLACIVAYFLSHGVWRRVAVIASVVPLAMLANILRVIVTVQMVSAAGVEFAQGLLHEGFGVATYIIGTLAMIGVARVLR